MGGLRVDTVGCHPSKKLKGGLRSGVARLDAALGVGAQLDLTLVVGEQVVAPLAHELVPGEGEGEVRVRVR